MSAPAPAAGPVDDSLNPSLEGADERDARRGRRGQEGSVEDPLQDWPEDGAADRDDWLLDRDAERADP